jgi:ribosomal-protein-alanine N-acetyltransferase
MEFRLREWRPDDIESVVRYADNPRIARNLRDAFPNPYTAEDARRYIQSCIGGDLSRKLCLAIEAEKEAVGSIGVFLKDDVYRMSAEIGYWLGEPFWGKGI